MSSSTSTRIFQLNSFKFHYELLDISNCRFQLHYKYCLISAMMERHQKRMHPQHTVTIQHRWLTLMVRRLLLEVGTIQTTELKYSTLKIINGQRLLTTHIIKCKYARSHKECVIILFQYSSLLNSINRRWRPYNGWSQRQRTEFICSVNCCSL